MFPDFVDVKHLCARQFNVSLDELTKYRMGGDVIFTDDMKVS